MKRKMILDCDTGTDDAVAIMLAALHPDIELVGITTVNGNTDVDHCTDNSLRVLDYIGCPQIPVYRGCERPIVRVDFPRPRSEQNKEQIQGNALDLPEARTLRHSKHAVEYLIETYREATEEIVLVPVGPLTNIATALSLDPDFVHRVPEVVIMGGAHATGNMTPSAEFNIWGDPEAAAIVMAAGFKKLTMVPLDATHMALVTSAHCEALKALGTPAGMAAAKLIAQRIVGYDAKQPMAIAASAPVHDAVCVNFLVTPEVITTRKAYVAVETRGELTLGRTVMDFGGILGRAPNCDVAMEADAEIFNKALYDTFSLVAESR